MGTGEKLKERDLEMKKNDRKIGSYAALTEPEKRDRKGCWV